MAPGDADRAVLSMSLCCRFLAQVDWRRVETTSEQPWLPLVPAPGFWGPSCDLAVLKLRDAWDNCRSEPTLSHLARATKG